MDVSQTVAPKSDQVNAEDLFGGPRTVTITSVSKGTAEQPVFIGLEEFPDRTYRPSKGMRRVLLAAWGPDSSTYIGRRMTIFNDPHVKWAGQEVGGIRISHLSHIKEEVRVALTVTRGNRAPFVVQPLGTDPLIAVLQSAETLDALKAAWEMVTRQGKANVPELVQLKDARKAALSAEPGVTA